MLWTNRGCDTDYFCPIETPPPTRYHVDVMPGLTTNRFVNFSTNGIAPGSGNRLKPTFSLANLIPRGGRFLGTKKKVIRLVAVAQVKMLAVLCCGRKQPLAPAAKLENIFYSSVLCFFPVCLFFLQVFLCLTHLFFSWSFLLWFCVVVSAGFSLSFPLSTVFCLLFKHCICNALPFCFLPVGLSRLLIC